MDLSPGQYFLIQFSPSPARHERLNVGVIAICESWMKFKFDPDITRRVSDFCGAKWAVPVVHGQCSHLEQWLASLSLRDITVDILSERIEELSRRLANEIVISGPYVRLFSDFDTLFDELVPVPKDRVPESGETTYLDQSGRETLARRRDMGDKAGWKEIETVWEKVSDVEAWVVSEGDCGASMVFLRLAKVGSFWSARLDVNEFPSMDSFTFQRSTPREALGVLEGHVRFNRTWVPDRIRTALNTLPKGVE